MRPVKQDKFGFPEGNCFAASLASILELPLSQVPNYVKVSILRKDPKLADRLYNQWLRKFGLKLERTQYPPKDEICIASGMARRGFLHAVVWYNGQVIHDPHPDNTGLTEKPVGFIRIVKRESLIQKIKRALKLK